MRVTSTLISSHLLKQKPAPTPVFAPVLPLAELLPSRVFCGQFLLVAQDTTVTPHTHTKRPLPTFFPFTR
jgi:hypothetical protein